MGREQHQARVQGLTHNPPKPHSIVENSTIECKPQPIKVNTMKHILEVTTQQYSDIEPGGAIVDIDKSKLDRILLLRKAAVDLDVYCVSEFDYSITWTLWNSDVYEDEDENGDPTPSSVIRVIAPIINVTKTDVYWTAHPLDSDQTWETHSLLIEDLTGEKDNV